MTDEAAVVPPGERDALQRTAQETGERFGKQDALIGEHGSHLDKINGSIGDLASALAQQATSIAVLAAATKNIESVVLSGSTAVQRKQGISIQIWLAIFAAVVAICIAIGGFVASVVIALIVTGKI